ncbi:MAG: DUF971 domain-containing protein [Alphaproteobacteria bacterium]|nr:DUF971 domain-containing protein [Alphaproteobacteria bacterium]
MAGSDSPTPPAVTEARLDRGAGRLHLTFEDGARYSYSAEFLRVLSPSAEVQGHGPGPAVTVPGKRGVGITALEAVGNYALRILFDDGHDTGIYSWAYFRELGEEQAVKWSRYLEALDREGLSRDP